METKFEHPKKLKKKFNKKKLEKKSGKIGENRTEKTEKIALFKIASENERKSAHIKFKFGTNKLSIVH